MSLFLSHVIVGTYKVENRVNVVMPLPERHRQTPAQQPHLHFALLVALIISVRINTIEFGY